MSIIPLNQAFYEQPTLTLAQELLGKLLVKETTEGIAAGYIVETEAYIGPDDKAAHSYGNRRTKRTEIMFGPPGHFYVYTMHTHHLVNVVSGSLHAPEAVLIRALEPYIGIELMQQRRPKAKRLEDLTNGPGKLTKALGIDKADYGLTCDSKLLYFAEGIQPTAIQTGRRIGIENSGEAKEYPWRFWIEENRFVSKRS
ncbi:DNA-3-methyladenine glycosylase [Halalkalibacter urbisdiaboli]|uniref:DNA-3-methyladenine glycosylase n=1 Tax=Halalkalibacter urbisdiaboli TaxID=1960589 RepID=UPI001FDA6C56|nr:DNA-3-methyladenine glycosylase [Halalkalibacter urbisdiaboli]